NQHDDRRQPIESAARMIGLIIERGGYQGFLGRGRHVWGSNALPNASAVQKAVSILVGIRPDIIPHYKNSYHKMKFCLNICWVFPRMRPLGIGTIREPRFATVGYSGITNTLVYVSVSDSTI